MPPRTHRVAVLALAAVVVAAAAGCGGDDDDDADADPEPSRADLEVEVEREGDGLRIDWTVTNEDDDPLIVLDGRPADAAPDEELADAYVTGRPDGTVEISRRVFPVPDGVEVDGEAPTTRGVEVQPGESTSGTEVVPLPPAENPPAPEGTEAPASGAETGVFCVGVGPADGLDASDADDPDHVVVTHSEGTAAVQTLLCGDAIDLTGE